MIKIDAIKLPDAFDIYKNTDGEKAEFLEPISKINIFVGSNNSGKSRFVRSLSKLNKYLALVESFNIKEVNNRLRQFVSKIETEVENNNLVGIGFDKNAMSQVSSNIPSDITTVEGIATINEILKNWSDFKPTNGRYRTQEQMYSAQNIRKQSLEIISYIGALPKYSTEFLPKKFYVPSLRGLRSLDDSHSDFYARRTIQDYFEPTTNVTPEVFTGLSLYQEITDLLLGSNSERKLIYEYQKFISEKLFEGKDVSLIPNQKQKVVIVKIGNEKEQPIHHLGDGIQSAIILSFMPFVMQEQTFFFIEEPEMYLHPGLQRKILNFYNSLEQHTFFLTTHSNHFLDITIDIKDVSIFTFRKVFDESDEDELTPNFTIEAVDSGCESSLELLGVRNSSVFLVNATIWVEGITDRWYFRKMLVSYMDYLEKNNDLKMRLEEDTHYSFVEYGGANITHWSFLDYEEHPIEVERLCAKATVIVDGDGEKKMKRKEDLQRILDKRLIILPCREVENLLPYKVIKEIVAEFEDLPDSDLKNYSYEKYQNEYLGTFIESMMLKSVIKRRRDYREKPPKTGTLKGKLVFCEKALPKIRYEDLNDSTKEIIRNIYNFVYQQNTK